MAMRNAAMAGRDGMEGMPGMDHSPDSLVVRDTLGPIVARFSRFSGWPEIKEAFMAGQLDAAYLLAPLAMDLADQGFPVKIVALGHRSGAVIMVRSGSPARNIGDLRGVRLAIPSRFAVDHLYVRRLMRQYGMRDGDLNLVEIAPPDMPAALAANAIEAYATGEPWGALAQRDGTGRVLHWTRADWPDYICCVLVVRTDRIATTRPMIQHLVDNVTSAGAWIEADTNHRALAAGVAARPEFFNTDSALIRFVLENPRDRVTYRDLNLVRRQLEDLMQLGLEAGILRRPVPYETYADESFLRAARAVEIRVDHDRPRH
jgi:NitT/TauT family transport system substrate-binding protein